MSKNTLNRRQFIKTLCLATCGLLADSSLPIHVIASSKPSGWQARYYEKVEGRVVRCLLCPRMCTVTDGQRGYCRVRENRGGEYYSLVYGKPCTYHIDPIEKKPFFHFLPGTTAFSLATVGCNLSCKFCQNWEISQQKPEDVDSYDIQPAEIAEIAIKYRCPTIAFTYTEPTVYFEYMVDIASQSASKGIRNVMVSAGYINKKPLLELVGLLDAIKIDLKALSEDFYIDVCSATLQPVLDTIVTIKQENRWLEIVNLIIPTLNDDKKQIERLCSWLVSNVGTEVPIHFTRFYPTYKLRNLPPTPVRSVEVAREIALSKGIKFAYVGNVPAGNPGESTYCPSCGTKIIERWGYSIRSIRIKDGKCDKCGCRIPGIWS